jgi:hypothetical protein
MKETEKSDVLIAEYKEMRDEIRAAWTQYYSLLVGIGLTGIASSFYFAVSRCNEWLFIAVPILTVAWLALITTIRANIKHISNYIEKLEKSINSKVMFYETTYAKKLWRSWSFLCLHFLIILPLLLGIQPYSIYRGYFFLRKPEVLGWASGYSNIIANIFLSLISILTVLVVLLMIFLPIRVSRGSYDEEKKI